MFHVSWSQRDYCLHAVWRGNIAFPFKFYLLWYTFLTDTSFCSVPDNLGGPAPMGLLTPSAMGSKLRRPSALPTPANRRISGIPALTPKSLSRLSKPTKSTLLPSALGQVTAHLRFLFYTSFKVKCWWCSALYGDVIWHYLYSPGNKKSENQDDKEESTAETCPPADLQPCSLVFSQDDEIEEPPVCDPDPSPSHPEPSSCDQDPSSCDPEPSQIIMEPPTLPDTNEIKDSHLQITEKQDVKNVITLNLWNLFLNCNLNGNYEVKIDTFCIFHHISLWSFYDS